MIIWKLIIGLILFFAGLAAFVSIPSLPAHWTLFSLFISAIGSLIVMTQFFQDGLI